MHIQRGHRQHVIRTFITPPRNTHTWIFSLTFSWGTFSWGGLLDYFIIIMHSGILAQTVEKLPGSLL